jgi:hypothetical protein
LAGSAKGFERFRRTLPIGRVLVYRKRPRSLALVAVSASLVFTATAGSAQDLVWLRLFGSDGFTAAYGLALDANENTFAVGYLNGHLNGQKSAGDDDAFLRSYDANGTPRWTRQFGTASFDQAAAASVDGAGNVYVVGDTEGAFPGQTLTGGADAFVRKFDAAGNHVWTRQFGKVDRVTFARDVEVGENGYIYVTGDRLPAYGADLNVSFQAGYLTKLAPDGTILWTREYGNWPAGMTSAGVSVGTGRITVAGSGCLTSSAPCPNAFVITFDPAGTQLWAREFTLPGGLASIADVDTNPSGLIAVAGSGYREWFIRVYDRQGTVRWTKRIVPDKLIDVVETDAAGNVYYGGGKLNGFTGETYNAILGRYNADGTFAWESTLDSSNGESVTLGLRVGPTGSIYAAGGGEGRFHGRTTPGFVSAFVLKIDQTASCSDTANPYENENGPVSKPIHKHIEPLLPAPADGAVHAVNCIAIAPTL